MGVDFSQLYSLLDLEPDCSLEQLKHAYRKRVAELHPDRRASQDPNDEATGRLATLLPLYRMAIQFHEQHGRLPGGMGDASTPKQPPPPRRDPAAPPLQPRRTPPEPLTTPGSHRWLLLVLVCLIAYLVLSALPHI